RQIDREDGNAQLGDVADHVGVDAGRRANEAGAEDRIDEEIRIRRVGEVVVNRDAEALADEEIGERVAGDLRAVAGDDEDRHDAAAVELARYRESVAAVLSDPADER